MTGCKKLSLKQQKPYNLYLNIALLLPVLLFGGDHKTAVAAKFIICSSSCCIFLCQVVQSRRCGTCPKGSNVMLTKASATEAPYTVVISIIVA